MADEHHGTRELASAIRAGAERRPEQAFGDYFVGRRASCALGAGTEGIYRLAADMSGQRPTKDLTTFFDCLEGTIRACPVEGCKKRLLLSAMIAPPQRPPRVVAREDRGLAGRKWRGETGARHRSAAIVPELQRDAEILLSQ